MTKVLVVEKPYKGAVDYPWTDETRKAFNLDSADVAALEEGSVVWQGETGISLEEEA